MRPTRTQGVRELGGYRCRAYGGRRQRPAGILKREFGGCRPAWLTCFQETGNIDNAMSKPDDERTMGGGFKPAPVLDNEPERLREIGAGALR